MLALGDYAVIVGTVLLTLGACCIPVGIGASPKRDLSVFNNFADVGTFFSVGLGLIGVGLSIIVLALLFAAVAAKVRRPASRRRERRGDVRL